MEPNVLVDISISVDGFIARRDDSAGPIHEWFFGGAEAGEENRGRIAEVFDPAGASRDVLEENLSRPGAVVAGRRTYDFAGGWGGEHPSGVPVVVVTSRAPDPARVPRGSTEFHFVDGVAEAVSRAKELAAGREEVHVMGGSRTIAGAFELGLVDQLQVHVAPVLLGDGVRLIDGLGRGEVRLEQTRVVEAPDVTHIRFRVN